jgi:signal transduction histidine kinase
MLLADAVADLRPQAEAAGVAIETEAPADDTEVVVDRLLLTRALANLVSNAIRHGPRGSVVRVDAVVAGGRLRVGVRDQGPGLDAEQLALIALGDRGAAVRDARGVGLGLLFVQRVARRHGGRLHAESPAGGGARFVLDVEAGSGIP